MSAMKQKEDFQVEQVNISSLRPHPRNYRVHPEDQLEHLVASIKEHGFYRNIIIAKDNTILAGHGVIQAATKMGVESVPIIRLDIDPLSTSALKVLAGDNGLPHLAETDDRALTELLKQIRDEDNLLGTGYDEMMLANLVFVTRPENEVRDFNEASQWVGLPEYEEGKDAIKLVITFPSEAERQIFLDRNAITEITGGNGGTKSTFWPPKGRDDRSSVKFET